MTRSPHIVIALASCLVAGSLAACSDETETSDGPHIVELVDQPEHEGSDPPPLVTANPDSNLLAKPVGQLDEWDAVERSGRVMSTGDLRGRFSVVSFIFTSCNYPCPPMCDAMKLIQNETKGADDLVLASFTVDPERDTPEVLSEFADGYGADKERWLFLRLSLGHIKAITRDELLVGDGGDPIMHSAKLILLDKQGRGRAYYEPTSDGAWFKKLQNDLETLRAEPSDG